MLRWCEMFWNWVDLMVSPCFTFLNDSYLGWWFTLTLLFSWVETEKPPSSEGCGPNDGLSSRPRNGSERLAGMYALLEGGIHGLMGGLHSFRHFFGCWTCRIYRIFKQETKRKRPSDGGSGVVWPFSLSFMGRKEEASIPASPIFGKNDGNARSLWHGPGQSANSLPLWKREGLGEDLYLYSGSDGKWHVSWLRSGE